MPGSEELCSSSEEEEEEIRLEHDTQWRSKNGDIMWCPTREEDQQPCERFLSLFFAEDIMQLILHFTDLQGKRSVKDGKDVGEEELRAYMGLLILYRSQH